MRDLTKERIQRSYFTGSYHWKEEAVENGNEKGWIFCFSGQGTSFPGMLRPLKDEACVVSRLAIADQLALNLGLPAPSSYCLDPDSLDEDETSSIELFALLTAEVAIAETLVCHGIRPSAITCHSFGEYAGLVVAGVLSFESAFYIVADRESSCPAKHSAGYLLAVGATDSDCYSLLEGIQFSIALKNSPSQTVLALTWDCLLDAETRLRQRGVKYVRLNLPQPYHCEALAPAAKKMAMRLAQRGEFASYPRIPFLSSVTHSWLSSDQTLNTKVIDILTRQLTEPVDFVSQVNGTALRGTGYLEIGCRPILKPFLGEILREKGFAITHCFEVLSEHSSRPSVKKETALPSEKQHALVELVRSVIAKATGYRIEQISLEDRIQEDLGIDSLKFTEIMIQISESTNHGSSQGLGIYFPKTVADVVLTAQNLGQSNAEAERLKTKVPAFERLTLKKEAKPIFRRSQSPLNSFSIVSIDTLAELDKAGPEVILVFGGTQDGPIPIAESQMRSQFLSQVMRIRSWLERHGHSKTKLALCLSRQSSAIGFGFVGFFKSLRKEMHLGSFRCLHFDHLPDKNRLKVIVDSEFGDGDETEVSYEKDVRFIPLFCKQEREESALAPMRIVAVGGARGILAELIQSISWAANTHFIIWGRTQALSESQQQWMAKLREKEVRVSYYAVDVTDQQAVLGQLDLLKSEPDGITQVWNGAGLEMSRELFLKSEDEIWQEFRVKWLSATHLSMLCDAIEVKQFIQFSSIIAHFGNRGQTIYAATNGATDALLKRSLPQQTALTVLRWPPWDNVGMTSDPLIAQSLRAAGVSLLSKESAVNFFRREISGYETKSEVGEVYYHDRQDDLIYEWPLSLNHHQKQVLGKSVSHEGQVSLVQLFTRQSDAFLWDHSMSGELVFPAAMGISMFVEACRALCGQCNGLKQFRIHRPMKTDREAMAIRTGGIISDSKLSLFLGNPNPAFFTETIIEPWEFLEIPNSGEATESISAETIYGVDGLFHGPSFHLQGIIHIGKDHLDSNVDATSNEMFARGFGILPLAIDSAMQLLYLSCYRSLKLHSLPNQINALWISEKALSPQTRKVRVLVNPIEITTTKVTGNAFVFGEEGELLIGISGLHHFVAPVIANEVKQSL